MECSAGVRCSAGVPTGVFGAEDSAATKLSLGGPLNLPARHHKIKSDGVMIRQLHGTALP